MGQEGPSGEGHSLSVSTFPMFAYPHYKMNRNAARLAKGGILAGFYVLLLFLAVAATAASNVTLAWNRSDGSDVAGYHLHQGTVSGSYTNQIDVGNVTNAIVSGLTPGITYFFAVSAYTTLGLESELSAQASYTPPVSTTSSPPVIALTSPSSGATYTAPTTIPLAATVTPNGHTISKVQFYNGASLLGESGTAPYEFSWNNVGAGTYSLKATAVYDAGSTVASSVVGLSVTTAVSNAPAPISLPAPWQTLDIGSVGTAGSLSVSNGLYTVTGAGTISGTSDSFRFVYQPLTGDGQITAQLSSVQNTGPNGAVGVMIRESLTPGARYALMSLSTGDLFQWQRRMKTSFKTWSASGGSAAPPQAWVRIVRTGSTFSGYSSIDGVNWNLESSFNISMAINIYIGLAVASGGSGVLNTSEFSNLNVVP